MSVDKKNMKRRVEALKSLPTMPGVFEKINRLMANPKTSAKDIGDVIASDPALSAKVIRIVNSAFYGFPGRISSVTHALIILGFDVVRGLVLSTSVFNVMLAKGYSGLWEHSLGCAAVAGIIAKKTKDPNPEEASLAALLHDIGKVMMKIQLPEESSYVDQEAAKKQISIYEAEEAILGVTHTTIGNWLCKQWNLPDSLSDPIIYHHKPNLSKVTPRSTTIVHVANALVRGIGFGFAGDNLVPQIDPKAWEALGISDSLLEKIIEEMADKLENAEDFLSGNGIGM